MEDLLPATAACRHILRYMFCRDCAGHRLTKLIFFSAFSFHILSILDGKHLHSIAWKKHDMLCKLLPMRDIDYFHSMMMCNVYVCSLLVQLVCDTIFRNPVCLHCWFDRKTCIWQWQVQVDTTDKSTNVYKSKFLHETLSFWNDCACDGLKVITATL